MATNTTAVAPQPTGGNQPKDRPAIPNPIQQLDLAGTGHDIDSYPPEIRPVASYFLRIASKLYASGFLNKKNDLTPEGKPFALREWTRWYVELCGPVLMFWACPSPRASSQKIKASSTPNFINITDSTVEFIASLDDPEGKREHVFSLNSAGANRFYLQAQSPSVVNEWVVAIRLACFEISKLHELYTEAFLNRPQFRQQFHKGLPDSFQGHLQARIAGSTEWKRVYVTVGQKKSNKAPSIIAKKSDPASDPRGHVQIFRSKKSKKPLVTFHKLFQAYAVYPENASLVDLATISKYEGSFVDRGKSETTPSGHVLFMAESPVEMAKLLSATFVAFNMHGVQSTSVTPGKKEMVNMKLRGPISEQNLFLSRPEVQHISSEGTDLIQCKVKFAQLVDAKVHGSDLLDQFSPLERNENRYSADSSLGGNSRQTSTSSSELEGIQGRGRLSGAFDLDGVSQSHKNSVASSQLPLLESKRVPIPDGIIKSGALASVPQVEHADLLLEEGQRTSTDKIRKKGPVRLKPSVEQEKSPRRTIIELSGSSDDDSHDDEDGLSEEDALAGSVSPKEEFSSKSASKSLATQTGDSNDVSVARKKEKPGDPRASKLVHEPAPFSGNVSRYSNIASDSEAETGSEDSTGESTGLSEVDVLAGVSSSTPEYRGSAKTSSAPAIQTSIPHTVSSFSDELLGKEISNNLEQYEAGSSSHIAASSSSIKSPQEPKAPIGDHKRSESRKSVHFEKNAPEGQQRTRGLLDKRPQRAIAAALTQESTDDDDSEGDDDEESEDSDDEDEREEDEEDSEDNGSEGSSEGDTSEDLPVFPPGMQTRPPENPFMMVPRPTNPLDRSIPNDLQAVTGSGQSRTPLSVAQRQASSEGLQRGAGWSVAHGPAGGNQQVPGQGIGRGAPAAAVNVHGAGTGIDQAAYLADIGGSPEEPKQARPSVKFTGLLAQPKMTLREKHQAARNAQLQMEAHRREERRRQRQMEQEYAIGIPRPTGAVGSGRGQALQLQSQPLMHSLSAGNLASRSSLRPPGVMPNMPFLNQAPLDVNLPATAIGAMRVQPQQYTNFAPRPRGPLLQVGQVVDEQQTQTSGLIGVMNRRMEEKERSRHFRTGYSNSGVAEFVEKGTGRISLDFEKDRERVMLAERKKIAREEEEERMRQEELIWAQHGFVQRQLQQRALSMYGAGPLTGVMGQDHQRMSMFANAYGQPALAAPFHTQSMMSSGSSQFGHLGSQLPGTMLPQPQFQAFGQTTSREIGFPGSEGYKSDDTTPAPFGTSDRLRNNSGGA